MVKLTHLSIAAGFATLVAACAARESSVPATLEPQAAEAKPTPVVHEAPSIERVGDVDEPLAVFESFLASVAAHTLDTEAGRALVGGEFAKESDVSGDEPLGDCDAIVRIDAEHAVARVTVHDPGGEMFKFDKDLELPMPAVDTNLYFYLDKTDVWRVTAVRALAQTWFQASMVALDDAYPQKDPKLRELAENARMTLMSDQQVVTWFGVHRTELEALAIRTSGLAPGKFVLSTDESELSADLRALHVSNAELRDDRTVAIVIGGITDNSVGLMHVVDPAMPPHISPNDVIWAQALGGGWFLFRTT